jgi:hypothetical protein
VDHAHLHVVPGRYKFPLPTPGSAQYPDLGTFLRDGAEEWAGRPYVITGQYDGPCEVGSDPGVPQYFRRRLAERLGRPDHWDYAAVPSFETVRETVSLLTANPGG